MEKRRVAVTGLGVIAPNGVGTAEFWQATVEGRSGIGKVDAFDTSHLRCGIAGRVTGFDPLQWMDRKEARRIDRFAQFGLAAAHMAVEDSGLDLASEDRTRAGSIIGSGLGGALFHEEQILAGYQKGLHRLNALCVPRITPNAVAAHVAIHLDLLGPNMVISTACASGSHAIGESFRKIQHGEADIIISGGAEAPLTEFTFGAYAALGVLSKRNDAPTKASRPFDSDRDGFVLAEGAACLVLEELEHAVKRGAHVYAEVIGYGMSSGAYHIVIPDPEGHDAIRAMRQAMADGNVQPSDVDYLNAHGTSTVANDVSETRAIKAAFGDCAAQLPVSSTKSMTGHPIGAAGGIEAAVCCLAIEHNTAPPTINYETPDPECDLDYVPNRCRQGRIDVAMSNSFAFGNANACLIFSRAEA